VDGLSGKEGAASRGHSTAGAFLLVIVIMHSELLIGVAPSETGNVVGRFWDAVSQVTSSSSMK